MANLTKLFQKLLSAPTDASRRKFLKSVAAAPLAAKMKTYQSFAPTPPNDPILALHKDYLKHLWDKAHEVGKRIAGDEDYLQGMDEEPGLASYLEIPGDQGGYVATPEELSELFSKHGLEPTKELVNSLDDLRKRSILSAYIRHPGQSDYGGSWDYDDLRDQLSLLWDRDIDPNEVLFNNLTDNHLLSKEDLAELLKLQDKNFPLADNLYDDFIEELDWKESKGQYADEAEDEYDDFSDLDFLLNELPVAPRGTRTNFTPGEVIGWPQANVEHHPNNPTRYLTTYLDEDYQ